MGIILVFSLATLVSAWLMFSVEPLLAKMMLPEVGGAASVWNAALVFFQVALLAGYAFAHVLGKLAPKPRAIAHALVIAAGILALPIHLRFDIGASLPPAIRIFVILTVGAGLPFFALSTNGSALARALSSIDHPRARDPYFLYAASNTGSILALASYPFLVERFLPLSRQVRMFGIGYGVLTACVGACAVIVIASRTVGHTADVTHELAPAWKRRLRWLVLATIPSAQLVAATQYLTTNVAAAPLLWTIPLLVYLLSFVLVFARRLRPRHAWMARALPLAGAIAILTLASEVNQPVMLVAFVHVATLFLGAMVCHGELVDDRPAPEHLTSFYLWMSAGGVAGGLAVAILAPAILDRNAEYGVTIVAALALRPPPPGSEIDRSRRAALVDVAHTAAMGVLMLGCVWLVGAVHATGRLVDGILAIPIFVLYRTLVRPARFALALLAILVASAAYEPYGTSLLHERSFFGALRVSRSPDGFIQLVHGSTVHGRQAIDPTHHAEATSYYHLTGPAGDVLSTRPHVRVGVIGLGAGSLAAYAEPGEAWTFYEINPSVVAIASDKRWFSFLSDLEARGARLRLDTGDARLRLAMTDERYDVLVVDAFSSDAIPVHLVTLEAMRLYAAHLTPDGAVLWHISNDYLDLEPILAALAVETGFHCATREDLDAHIPGKFESKWALMTRGLVLPTARWREARARPGLAPWTDDASSIIPILK